METKIYDSRTKEPIVGTLPVDGLRTLRGDVMIVTEEGKVFHISPPDAEAAGCDCFMKAEKIRVAQESLVAKFAEAKASGQPVLITSWMEDCNSPKEDCSFDSMAKYAMLDGTTKTSRSHD